MGARPSGPHGSEHPEILALVEQGAALSEELAAEEGVPSHNYQTDKMLGGDINLRSRTQRPIFIAGCSCGGGNRRMD
jgi:hypothetical protein